MKTPIQTSVIDAAGILAKHAIHKTCLRDRKCAGAKVLCGKCRTRVCGHMSAHKRFIDIATGQDVDAMIYNASAIMIGTCGKCKSTPGGWNLDDVLVDLCAMARRQISS